MPRPPLQLTSTGAAGKRPKNMHPQLPSVSPTRMTAAGSMATGASRSTSPARPTPKETHDESGPDTKHSGGSDGQVKFLQEQHAKALGALQSEIDTLKAENADLRFRLVMRDSTASSGADAMISLQKQLDAAKDEMDKMALEKEELLFDLRQAREAAPRRSTGKAGQQEEAHAANVEALEATIQSQALEIAKLRAQLAPRSTQGATVQAATLSERPYVFRLGDLNARTRPTGKNRRLSTQELQSLAEQRRRVRCGTRVEEHMNQVAAAHSVVGTLDGGDILRSKPLPHIGRKPAQ